jgi:folate-dependent phosphoribosylglycinamide formyltransferase PurN
MNDNYCIITNSKLGTFLKTLKIFKLKKKNFLIISTKRYKFPKKKNIKVCYFSDQNYINFNKSIFNSCVKFKPKKIILFYTKLIDKLIFDNFYTVNIHNSLLPNYKGLNAIKKTFRDKNKIFCSTAHLVNEKFDSGEILYQVTTPITKSKITILKKIAFKQRILLLLALLTNNNLAYPYTFLWESTVLCPGLDKNKFKKGLLKLKKI